MSVLFCLVDRPINGHIERKNFLRELSGLYGFAIRSVSEDDHRTPITAPPYVELPPHGQ